MENLIRDLKFGLRLLARNPGFATVAVLSLALGIGINTAMFSVVNAILFTPAPVRAPDRLAEIYTSTVADKPYLTTSYPDFLDLRAAADDFSGMTGHALVRGIYRRAGDRAELVLGEVVSENYFDVLGVRPFRGRSFLPEENRTELTHPVVVLSHGFWQRRLGGDPGVVGRTLELSGVAYTVVGIAPREFVGTVPGLVPEFWAPLMMVEKLSFMGIQTSSPSPGKSRLERRGSRWLFVTARLAEGRTVEEARAQVQTIASRLVSENPDVNKGLRATLLPARAVRLHPMIDDVLGPAAAVLMGAVGLVLLIACANVANLLLARASARSREIAVRLAIGAGRGRIVRQLLGENLVLAVLGGGLGLVLAYWASRLLTSALPALPIPVSFRFALDHRVLLFAGLVSLATTALFGLAPALQTSRRNLVTALRGEGDVLPTRGRRIHLRDLLVMGQLALSVILLAAGALMLRGLAEAGRIDPGFDPRRLAVLGFNLKMNGYSSEQATIFQRRVVERLRAVPGVEHVSLVSRPPLGAEHSMEGIRIQGIHQPDDEPALIDSGSVDPDYFAALGLPVIEGRGFTDADDEKAPGVVVVTQAMARRFWPGRSAVGQRIFTEGFDGPSFEIVGVVPDYKIRSLGEKPCPYLHFAWRQQPTQNTTVLVRARGPAAPLVASLRQAILELEPAIVFTEEGTATDVLRLTTTPTRLGAGLLATFGALALLLAAVGLYGVVAQSVELRTREIGVRMALGADVPSVLGLVLGRGMRLAVAGVGMGLLCAAGLSRVLGSLLYGVSAVDPLAFSAAAALLLAVALLANLLPARRAARVDPLVALRHE
jgi:putative ABC transport system permease protein